MSDSNDPWKALHAKRSRKSTQSKTSDPFAAWKKPELHPISPPMKPKPIPIAKTTRRLPPKPEPARSRLPEQPRMDFSDPVEREPRAAPKTQSKAKERFLISIDMVSDENRELVRGAAASEGRTLSQWARRVLVSTAREK